MRLGKRSTEIFDHSLITFCPLCGSLLKTLRTTIDDVQYCDNRHHLMYPLFDVHGQFIPVYDPLAKVPTKTLTEVVEDLKYCPLCGWELETVTKPYDVTMKHCGNHGHVFLIRPRDRGWGILYSLGGVNK